MADRILQAFRNNHELQRFVFPEVETTGEKLGEGSYGSVEELKVKKGLVCAGKRLHKALVEQGNAGVEKIVSRFLEECKMMAEMRHPHIVQFLGLCYLEGSTLPVLVMERLERSLDELLEAFPGLPLPLKQSLLTDVARGLLYLHTHNPPIVHRDLSSRNVLLTSSLEAKIGDLGNARIINLQPGQLARLTRVPGALSYMPPESFADPPQYGPRLDIFSFGHLALFTFTQVFPGDLPHPTYPDPDNPGCLLARSEVERRKNYIQLLNGYLGEWHPFSQLVCQCLHNDPAQRPSAMELLERLEAVRPLVEGAYEHIIRCSSGGASSGDVQKTSNGCEVAKRVAKKKFDFRVPSGNIAAIHFQTSHCSVAYTTVRSGNEEVPVRLPLNTTHYRVPTAILFNPDGTIDSFGYDARAEYLNLENEERLEYAYFEEILHDKNVNREMKIKGKNGKEYHVIDVVAQILNYLKTELINHLQCSEHPLEATDFDWVITVPAIWKARGKQMMREAGYMAGLCSQERCDKLQEASVSVLPTLLNESDPDKLSLALEHECAAVYCRRIFEQQVAAYNQPRQSMCYLVVNIGSNTMDISAYRASPTPDRHVQVVHRPTGNDYLGINKEFEKFLEGLVNDEGFSKYLQTNDPVTKVKHSIDLSDLINKMFKEQMVIFGNKGGVGSKPDSKLAIHLPFTFLEVYKDDIDNGIRRMGDSRIERVGQDLRIEYSKMADFFQPVVQGMLEGISHTLREVDAKVDTIYLVGGFGGSQYIYKRITERFGNEYKYITPREPDFAVVRGAVLFRQHPDIVHARRADATYGVETTISFDPQIHHPEYKWVDDDGEEKCSNIFSTVVERDDLVCTKELFKSVFIPALHQQTSVSFKIYSTLEKDVWFTTGKRGRNSRDPTPVEICKIGEFEVQMPVLTGDKDRKINVVFDLSHTEIHVKAYDCTSRNEVKVVLDFLSA